MNYRLTFRPKRRALSFIDFSHHFIERDFFTLRDGDDETVRYANHLTGVVFEFRFSPLQLSIALGRPHVFGWEAAVEIAELAAAFDLAIDDSHTGETGIGVEHFKHRWAQANQLALKSAPHPRFTMPKRRLDGHWGWNIEHPELLFQMGHHFRVPSIGYLDGGDGHALSAVAWPAGRATILPRVDKVILQRGDDPRGRLIDWATLAEHCALTTPDAELPFPFWALSSGLAEAAHVMLFNAADSHASAATVRAEQVFASESFEGPKLTAARHQTTAPAAR